HVDVHPDQMIAEVSTRARDAPSGPRRMQRNVLRGSFDGCARNRGLRPGERGLSHLDERLQICRDLGVCAIEIDDLLAFPRADALFRAEHDDSHWQKLL